MRSSLNEYSSVTCATWDVVPLPELRERKASYTCHVSHVVCPPVYLCPVGYATWHLPTCATCNWSQTCCFLYLCLAMCHVRCVTILCNVGFVHNTCSNWIFFSVPRLVQDTWENCFGSVFSESESRLFEKTGSESISRFSMTKSSTTLQLKKIQIFRNTACTLSGTSSIRHTDFVPLCTGTCVTLP
jgi:hypothetical protein